MILCLDAGNTQIHGGIFEANELIIQFRKSTSQSFSADENGLFIKAVLRENGLRTDQIDGISICSVVPNLNHSLRAGCFKYMQTEPFFLKPGVKTGLKIKYRNPLEVGTDRIANAIAASWKYPDENIIIVDFGTATTFCVITKNKEYLGGIIAPGVKISMEALENNAAQLPVVEITETDNVIGKSTVESIQSGLYHGQIGMVREIINKASKEAFDEDTPKVLATGGFAKLFESTELFDEVIPTMALEGLRIAYNINHKEN